MATVKRRVFTILAAVSLVLCLATAGLWVRSYWRPGQSSGAFSYLRCTRQQVHLAYPKPRVWSAASPTWSFVFPGLRYQRSQVFTTDYELAFTRPIVLHGEIYFDAYFDMPDGFAHELTVSWWLLAALTAVLPALWLWRYRRDRRVRSNGMPHCAKCDYNLTGNASGICPECGTPIPADLVRKPVT